MMKKNGGHKLRWPYIIKALINVCLKFDISVKGVKIEEDLEELILEAVKNHQ